MNLRLQLPHTMDTEKRQARNRIFLDWDFDIDFFSKNLKTSKAKNEKKSVDAM